MSKDEIIAALRSALEDIRESCATKETPREVLIYHVCRRVLAETEEGEQ